MNVIFCFVMKKDFFVVKGDWFRLWIVVVICKNGFREIEWDFIYLWYLRFLFFLLKINLFCGLLDFSLVNVYCLVIINLFKI